MKMRTLTLCFLLVTVVTGLLHSQSINIDEYKNFLQINKDMTPGNLYSMHPVGMYQYRAGATGDICFLDSVRLKYELTPYENELLGRHNFMVTERVPYYSMWEGFRDVFEKDLPVFISTDAILHALHMSYDAILKDLEKALIIPRLDSALEKMHEYTGELEARYSDSPEIMQAVKDYDVYFTVARKLLALNKTINCKYTDNEATVAELMACIDRLGMEGFPLFASTPRSIDFSQFTVRGHYTKDPLLGAYFKSMIWLGRIELYLIAPKPESENPISPEDVRRQIILSYLILEAAENTEADKTVDDIDNILKILVGESDNVKLAHLNELKNELKMTDARDLVDMAKVESFQGLLAQKTYADQKILSQVLWKNPCDPEKITPASAFLLFGQRFIIDSYVTGNVVWDKTKEKRMLPSCLDVLFALGNNAASEFLKKDLEQYKYTLNLGALRYLIDTYDDDFWKQSYYNSWLRAIRTLNPADDASRKKLPKFMQTAAWWQEKMNTQLASWAQLRHDNLLYAKQSYSGGVSCSNPDAYLEPYPEFYNAVLELSDMSSERLLKYLEGFTGSDEDIKAIAEKLKNYYETMSKHMATLKTIAQKELDHEKLSGEESDFLRSVYSYKIIGCGEYHPKGWYSELFYFEDTDPMKRDFVVADVHTAPTDAFGNVVGWVWHVGTGDVNLGVFIVENNEGELTAYAGPVMSFLEKTSLDFKRFTDEDWYTGVYKSEITSRPEFVNLYLADKQGNSRGSGSLPVSLPVGVDEPPDISTPELQMASVPNPFTDHTVISFPVSMENAFTEVKVEIYNNELRQVNTLYSGNPQQGNYSVRWDGTTYGGAKVPSGTYYCRLSINGKAYTHKIVVIR